jgi:bifunctional non-homologous end joining protein LigD
VRLRRLAPATVEQDACRRHARGSFRVIARKDGITVRLYSRLGNDLTWRFPQIAEAVARLRSRSCIIDGEAVACGKDGVASFDRLRYRRDDANVFMYAFDLIELDGDDLRREPLEVRKATLASVVVKAGHGVRFNEHMICDDGEIVFRHACLMGWRGLCPNGRARLTAPVARPTGLR